MSTPVLQVGAEPGQDDVDALIARVSPKGESRLHTRPRARPYLVEFAGMPRAGKTGSIDAIADFLKNYRFAVFAPHEGASRAPQYIKSRNLVAYNLWTASYAITHILESSYLPRGARSHFVLLDRGVFDAIAWFTYLEKREPYGELTRDRVSQFLRVPALSRLVDLVLVFICSPTAAVAREETDRLVIRETRTVTEEEDLAELKKIYLDNVASYSEDFRKIICIDTTDAVSTKAVAYLALTQILETVAGKRGKKGNQKGVA